MDKLSPDAREIYDLLLAETEEAYEELFLAHKKKILDAAKSSIDIAKTRIEDLSASSISTSSSDDLSPGPWSIYDFLVGSSSAPGSSASLHATSSGISASTSTPVSTPATKDDLTRGSGSIYDLLVGECASLASATVDVSTNLDSSDFSAPTPTICSSECSSKDAHASVQVITPSTTAISSTIISTIVPELVAPADSAKALDMEVTGDTAPTATICLPGDPGHRTDEEEPIDMSLTPWSAAPSSNAPPEDWTSPLGAPMDIQKLFKQSPSTCSTDCSGSSMMVFSTCPTTHTMPSCLPPLASTTVVTAAQCHDLMCTLNNEFKVDTEPSEMPPSMLTEAYHVCNDILAATAFVPWPPPSWSRAIIPLIHGQESCHDAQQRRGSELLVSLDSKENWNAMWLDVELKPPWPFLGVCMNLAMGWIYHHILRSNTHYSKQTPGDRPFSTTMELEWNAALTVSTFTLGVHRAQLQSTMFKWSDLVCHVTYSLIASTRVDRRLDLLLARQTTCTLWIWYYLHNLHCSLGSNNFDTTDWELLILSLETWLLLNCEWMVTLVEQLAVATIPTMSYTIYHHLPSSSRMLLNTTATNFDMVTCMYSRGPATSDESDCSVHLTIAWSLVLECSASGNKSGQLLSRTTELHASWDPGDCNGLVFVDSPGHNLTEKVSSLSLTCELHYSISVVDSFFADRYWVLCSRQLLLDMDRPSIVRFSSHCFLGTVQNSDGIMSTTSCFLVHILDAISIRLSTSKLMHVGKFCLLLGQFSSCDQFIPGSETDLGSQHFIWQIPWYSGLCPAIFSSSWLRMQPVVGCVKFHVAFLFSWDVISTSDSMTAFKHDSGMFSFALQICWEVVTYFAAALLLMISQLSENWVLYLPVTGIMQCRSELMPWVLANSKDGILTYTKRVLNSWDPGGSVCVLHAATGDNWNSSQQLSLHLTWDPGGYMQHRLEGKPNLKEGGLSTTSLLGWSVGRYNWAMAYSGARQGRTEKHICKEDTYRRGSLEAPENGRPRPGGRG